MGAARGAMVIVGLSALRFAAPAAAAYSDAVAAAAAQGRAMRDADSSIGVPRGEFPKSRSYLRAIRESAQHISKQPTRGRCRPRGYGWWRRFPCRLNLRAQVHARCMQLQGLASSRDTRVSGSGLSPANPNSRPAFVPTLNLTMAETATPSPRATRSKLKDQPLLPLLLSSSSGGGGGTRGASVGGPKRQRRHRSSATPLAGPDLEEAVDGPFPLLEALPAELLELVVHYAVRVPWGVAPPLGGGEAHELAEGAPRPHPLIATHHPSRSRRRVSSLRRRETAGLAQRRGPLRALRDVPEAARPVLP